MGKPALNLRRIAILAVLCNVLLLSIVYLHLQESMSVKSSPMRFVDFSPRFDMSAVNINGSVVAMNKPTGLSSCRIVQQPPPLPEDSNPHVYDVFAAENATFVYFITQRYYGRCAPKNATAEVNRSWLGKVFICKFTGIETGLEEWSYSTKVYNRDVYFATTIIRCPIPNSLRELAFNSGITAKLQVDLIPTHNLRPEGPVMPLKQLPVCAYPLVNQEDRVYTPPPKKHYLSACVWLTGDTYLRVDDVSKKQTNITDPLERLPEWIEYHLEVGFDHFYVYDNSEEAYGSLWRKLVPYIDRGLATYIHWPAKVCDRHRTSQYAAQNSCFRRFGEFSTWMSHFDVDEYMTPLSGFNNLKDVIRKYEHRNDVYSLGVNDHVYGLCQGEMEAHNKSKLFLEERLCFTGKKIEFKRKEIVKPDKVLYHYVHYVVQNFDGSKSKVTMLNDDTEAKLVHTRKWVTSKHPVDEQDSVVNKWLPKLRLRMASTVQ